MFSLTRENGVTFFGNRHISKDLKTEKQGTSQNLSIKNEYSRLNVKSILASQIASDASKLPEYSQRAKNQFSNS